jgi:hypothetical protein
MNKAKMVGPGMKISQPVVEVVGRALMDDAFRKQLFADVDKALQGYKLSAEEREVLKNIDHAALEAQVSKVSAGATARWAIMIYIRITF